MEVTINSKREEHSVQFAIEGATMQAQVTIINGGLHACGGPVYDADGQHIGSGSVNELGQHFINTAGGASPVIIAALLEQALAWTKANLLPEQPAEAEAEAEQPQEEE